MTKLLAYEELAERGIHLSKTQLWRLERENKFPRRVPISAQRHGWSEQEIDEFIAERIEARDG